MGSVCECKCNCNPKMYNSLKDGKKWNDIIYKWNKKKDSFNFGTLRCIGNIESFNCKSCSVWWYSQNYYVEILKAH